LKPNKGRPRMTGPIQMTRLVAALLGLPACAFAAIAAEVDSNGDGLLSVMEVQAILPDITAEQFSSMDLNADGALDEDEVQAAQEAGLIPVPGKG